MALALSLHGLHFEEGTQTIGHRSLECRMVQ